MYNVLIDFSDPVNGGVYRKGDVYPREGVAPTEERVAYLLGDGNKFGKPVIAATEDGKPDRLPCPYCDKDYANEDTLAEHIKNKHPEKE